GPRSHHEGDSGEVIPKFLLRGLAGKPLVIFGDGTQTRDFSYVEEIARGILLAGFAPAVVGETLNLGSGREIRINDLAATVARVIGRDCTIEHAPPRPGDVLRLFADAGKSRRLLGFTHEITLEEGLRRLKTWYDDLGQTPDELLATEVVHNWAPGRDP
ncbi:MAG: GDP-mannose 4,6-dehydratase, partial [Magnetococcales bacterium]|nr:GDP-mannose 4,6-dehydratase [Magnetococcales bacterium]